MGTHSGFRDGDSFLIYDMSGFPGQEFRNCVYIYTYIGAIISGIHIDTDTHTHVRHIKMYKHEFTKTRCTNYKMNVISFSKISQY